LVLVLLVPTLAEPGFATVSSRVFLPTSARQSRQAPSPSGSAINWQLTATDHFDITYAPELAPHLQRIRGLAERAYQQVSSDLQHELSLRPLLVLFGTRGELQQAIASGTVPGNREHILLPLDAPGARTDGDLVHELTHVFAFDIVPSSARTDIPRWMHEGLAELERGEWSESDLAMLRERLRINTLPRLGSLQVGASPDAAELYRIFGHAALDFLVARAGQDGLKRFLLSVRTSVANPTSVYLAAIGASADDFDQRFDEYLRARFPV